MTILFGIAKSYIHELEPPRIRPRLLVRGSSYEHYLRGPFTFTIFSEETKEEIRSIQLPLYHSKDKLSQLKDTLRYDRDHATWFIQVDLPKDAPTGPYFVNVEHPKIHAFTVDVL